MNAPLAIFFAQVDIPVPQGKSASFIFSDLALIFIIMLVLTACMLFWALVIRGPKQQSSGRRIYKDSDKSSDDTGESSGRRRKKKKVQRREHRKRNPTLAETGGLPEPRKPGVEPPI